MLNIQKGIRSTCMFREKLGLEGAYNLSDLLGRAQPYIKYEEVLLTKEKSHEARNHGYE